MIDIFFLILATYYIVEVMLIKPMLLGKGLFESEKKIILYSPQSSGEVFWYENFFDRLRGALIWKLYTEDEDNKRILNPKRAAVFMCPICLSFWVALFVSFFWWLPQKEYVLFLFSTFSVAGGSTFLHLYLMRGEVYDTD